MNKTALIKIRALAVIGVVGVVLFLVIFPTWKSCKSFEKAIVDHTFENLKTIARTESQHIERRFDDTLAELKVLAKNPKAIANLASSHVEEDHHSKLAGEHSDNYPYCPEELTYEHLMDDITLLSCIDNEGIVRCSFPEKVNYVGSDISDNPAVTMVRQTHLPYTAFVPNDNPAESFFLICYPVFDNEQFVGMLQASISQNTIRECLADSEIGQGGYACILDENGIAISHPQTKYLNKNILEEMKKDCPSFDWVELQEFISKMMQGQTGAGAFHSLSWASKDPEEVKKIAAYVPLKLANKRHSLAVVMEYSAIRAPVVGYTKNIATSASLLAMVSIAAGVGFYRIQKQKSLAVIKAKSADELQELNKQLEKETAALRTTERQLRQTNLNLEIASKRANELAQKAEMANVAKSEFLANMSHEIRTPMNSIIGFSELLGDEDLTETQKDYVNTISQNGQNLLQLINDILDFSKIEAGELRPEFIDCSLQKLLRSIDSNMGLFARKKSITFEVIEKTQLPEKICTDPTRLCQCLNNLINNAIKFTPEGHVNLCVSIENRNEEPYLRFDVEDTGIGIANDKLDSIFISFTQADGSTTRRYGGTGLGLTITKQLVGLLGGELTVTSQMGEGSVFSITIPTETNTIEQPNFNDLSDVVGVL